MLKALSFFVALFLAITVEAQPLCVSKSNVHLRKGPGSQFAVTWTVGPNMPLVKIGEKSGWYQVEDVDGERHWVLAKSVRVVSGAQSCAVVKTRTAELKKGPGDKQPASELARADRYTPFKKIDRDGEWVLLEDEYRGTYWVHESRIWIPMTRASISY